MKAIKIKFPGSENWDKIKFSSPQNLEKHLQRQGFDFPVLLDPSGFVTPFEDLEANHFYNVEEGSSKPQKEPENLLCSDMWQTMDCVHGMLELPRVCCAVIDTPEFQRLRFLSQLGASSYVYAGANHSRFTHSIGTASLAFKLILKLVDKLKLLQRNHVEGDEFDWRVVDISSSDILCVTLAGLCHDLGHGPFSHLWEGHVVPSLIEEEKSDHTFLKHEQLSQLLFRQICRNPKVERAFQEAGLNHADMRFVELLIDPPSNINHNGKIVPGKWPSDCSRPEIKRFLTEIVANKRNNLDVDKFDYLMRDCHHTGVKGMQEVGRILINATLGFADGATQIMWTTKSLDNLYDIFRVRDSLFRRVYRHRVTQDIDHMLKDALLAANPGIRIQGEDEKWLSLLEAQSDTTAYLHLADYLVLFLAHGSHVKIDWEHPGVRKAAEILKNLDHRHLYKTVGSLKRARPDSMHLQDRQALVEVAKHHFGYSFELEDFQLCNATFSWGDKDRNPMEDVRFLTKDWQVKHYRAEDISPMLPQKYGEVETHVMIRSCDPETINRGKEVVKQWVESDPAIGGFSTSRTSMLHSPEPYKADSIDRASPLFKTESSSPRRKRGASCLG